MTKESLMQTIKQRRDYYVELMGKICCNDEHALAEYLHDKNCQYSHTDGCGWYYEEDWYKGQYARTTGTKWGEHVHKKALTYARKLLAGETVKDIWF